MANYMMDADKQLKRQFSIAVKGYTFEFKTNYGKYCKWKDGTKRRMRRKAMALCREWAETIADEAKRRCPHYSGGLEQAIKISGVTGLYDKNDFGASKMSISVGVDGRAWQSTYDDYVIHLTKKGILEDAMLAGPALAIFLHENWDNVAGDEARKRAKRKENIYGRRVGSHFLLRAYTENEAKLQNMAIDLYKNRLAKRQSRDNYASVAAGIVDYDDEVPF